MAIYSLRLSPIGKTTQKRPHTAAAHIRYITRKTALTHAMAERMPEQSGAAMRWLRKEEDNDRKNARVADKLVIALPRELNRQQRIELVWGFAERLTQGRASWFAALHARGKDKDNPHCHLLVRDRDVGSGKRVVMFSAGNKEIKERATKGQAGPTTLKMIRELWAQSANEALEAAGCAARIDHRSLKDQGIMRPPEIHEGPNSRAMHARGFKPVSRDRIIRAPAFRKSGTPATRLLRYCEIDKGMTRPEYNDLLRAYAQSGELSPERFSGQMARRRSARSLKNSTAWVSPESGVNNWAETLADDLDVPLAEPYPGQDRGRGRR